MSQNLLLEIGTEEIPAHAMPSILAQLKKLGEDNLRELRLEHGEIKTLGTPRRLALVVENLAARQPDKTAANRGPSVKIAFDADGKPTKAAQGFARGQKVDAADLVVKGGYVYAEVHEVGAATETLLPELLPKLITSLNFPNNMRWGALDFKFIRPIRWLVGLYGEKIIDFTVANVKSGRISRGHRFLSQGDFSIADAADYEKSCEENFVIVDQNKRKDLIRREIEEAAKDNGGVAEITADLLEEVLYLVEYPTALVGKFDTEYLKLPAEAVITPMRDHQRYFPVKKDDKLLPLFVTVRNGGKEFLDTVRQGNERVLKARLEDAKFFFNEDCQKSLAEHRERLKTLVFQEGLGSVYEKTERMAKLTEFLADELGIGEPEKMCALQAAKLSKADLVTGMVTEFTELQGIMGREYARLDGENELTAVAIDEHYLPRFAGDKLPQTVPGRLVSIADKIDTIVGTFSRGKIPTGSEDPFALRRQALGLALTIIEAKYNLDLAKTVDYAAKLYNLNDGDRAKLQANFAEFMRLRLKNVLDNAKIRYDVSDAVLNDVADPYAVKIKAEALAQFLARDNAAGIVQALLRAVNIAGKAGNTEGEINPALFGDAAEKSLAEALATVEKDVQTAVNTRDYSCALAQLAKLQEPIDKFFDAVMVMDEDAAVRANRLALMQKISDLVDKIGDLTKLVIA